MPEQKGGGQQGQKGQTWLVMPDRTPEYVAGLVGILTGLVGILTGLEGILAAL